MIQLVVNAEQAKAVVSIVNSAFEAGHGILANQSDLVENQTPRGVRPGSPEHARFLFFIVPNDHGLKSNRLYEAAKLLYLERRELFDPKHVLGAFSGPDDPALVEATGQRLRARYPRETARSWFVNSEKLAEGYASDPARLLTSTGDAKVLLKRITQFRGFGPKTGGMLLRAAVGLGLSRVDGLEDVLLPVDIHDSRICFMTGVVSSQEELNTQKGFDYYKYVSQVQHALLSACNALEIGWLDVDRALWLIGSRGCTTRSCNSCPLRSECRTGQTVTREDSQLPLELM